MLQIQRQSGDQKRVIIDLSSIKAAEAEKNLRKAEEKLAASKHKILKKL